VIRVHVFVISTAFAAMTAAACAEKATPPTPARTFDAVSPERLPSPPPAAPAPAASPSPPRAPRALTEDELFARKTLAELNAESPLADVIYDFDQSALRD
jgi:hypothetical protein